VNVRIERLGEVVGTQDRIPRAETNRVHVTVCVIIVKLNESTAELPPETRSCFSRMHRGQEGEGEEGESAAAQRRASPE